jgi:hypothetical protein
MPQSPDLNGENTAIALLPPTANTAATTTYAGVDLQAVVGNVLVTLNWVRPNAATGTLALSILDSADNTTFAANATTGVISNVGTATSGIAQCAIDTRAVKRYVQPQLTATGTTATWTGSLVIAGLKSII